VSFCYHFPRKLVQIDEMSNLEEADLEQKGPGFIRVTHPPDQIIHGKPKWTDVSICKDDEDTGFSIDRLNPSRHMIEGIEREVEKEKAEETQKIIVNMLCDLKCELLVTLGDAKIDTEKEKILMEKHNEWENYKRKHNIKDWRPEVRTRPCRVLLKKVKVEEVNKIKWETILNRKRKFSEIDSPTKKSFKKKGGEVKGKTVMIKKNSSLLSWMSSNKANVTL